MSAQDLAESTRPATPDAGQSFEQAMERLESIVGEMENSKLPLEDLIRCYEEGTQLVKVCTERLAAAEQRIEIITRGAAGEAQTAPLTPGAAVVAAATAKTATPAKDPRPSPATPASPGRTAKKNNEVSLF